MPVCPLCGKDLTQGEYDRIIGRWKAREELQSKLREQLESLKKKRREIEESLRAAKRNYHERERELKARAKEQVRAAADKATSKERKRADGLSRMVAKLTEQLGKNADRIKELEMQLKKGTTPQLEGLNLEEWVVDELRKRFTSDEVEHHGHKGDVLQLVKYQGKQIGKILYECKRTQKFQKSYVKQTRQAVVDREARFGVLVTTAFPPESAGFRAIDDIFLVHPYGVADLAEQLREWVTQLHAVSADQKIMNERAAKLLEYARGEQFQTFMNDAVQRSFALRDLLDDEIRSHFATWKTRFEHYRSINKDVGLIRENSRRILRGEPILEREATLPEPRPIPQLMPPKEKLSAQGGGDGAETG
jgi:hypothetical protein